jgi:murein DD-endopeptidase MepM/ murein hydrolase activator NlpD
MACILVAPEPGIHVISVTIRGPMRAPRPLARPALIAAVVSGIVLGPFAVAFATAQDDGDVEDLRQEREDIRREAADAAAEIDELNAQDEELVGAIEALDAHIALQEARISTAEQSILDAEERSAAANSEAAARGADMETIRARLRLRAIDAFVAPRLDTLEQLNSDDLLTAKIKQTYIEELLGDEFQLIDQIRTAQAAQNDAERVAAEAAAEAEAERATLSTRLAALGASRREVEDLRAAVAGRIGEWEAVGREYEAADAAVAQEIRDLEAELARQEAAAEEARRLAEEEARRQAEADRAADDSVSDDSVSDDRVSDDSVSDDSASDDSGSDETATPADLGPFVVTDRPVPGVITSPFGPRVHPIFRTVRTHYGLDFQAGMSQPIVAAADGVVLRAGWMNGYGWAVVISHGNGVTTLYAHQSELRVETGDTVSGGDVVGLVGTSGWSTGAHLHWELRVDGVAVDPEPYL